jgi:hypothetical protein
MNGRQQARAAYRSAAYILVLALLSSCGVARREADSPTGSASASPVALRHGRPAATTLRTFGVPLPAGAADITYNELTGWSGRDLYLRFVLDRSAVHSFTERFDARRLRLKRGYDPFTGDDESDAGWEKIPRPPGLVGGSVSAATESSPAIDLCFVPDGSHDVVYLASGLA